MEPQIAFAVNPRDPTETVCDQRLVKFLMDQFLMQLAAVSGSKQPAIQHWHAVWIDPILLQLPSTRSKVN
jgi:hypothetical protein